MTILVNRLNKRVSVQQLQPTGETNEYGQAVLAPVDLMTIWAAIEPLRGQEFFAAMRENAEVTTRIRIRYREGIDRTMTVKYKSTEFEILHIIHPNFDKTELQLMCKERQ
jgi:SPP1 family predicted phage head-tail adaptor